MNKARRKRMNEVYTTIKTAADVLRDVFDEEEESMNNTPESLQNSERYYESEEICEALSSALIDLDSVVEELDRICE